MLYNVYEYIVSYYKQIYRSVARWFRSVVVITSALHAEGPQFDPGRDQFCLVLGGKILGERNLESNSTCQVGRVV